MSPWANAVAQGKELDAGASSSSVAKLRDAAPPDPFVPDASTGRI